MADDNDRVIRCLNCFNRIEVPNKADKMTCPHCEVKYVIAWRGTQAKIAGRAKD